MMRTSEDIEAKIQAVKNDIQAVKAANVNWITDPGDKALIMSLNSLLAAFRATVGRSYFPGF